MELTSSILRVYGKKIQCGVFLNVKGGVFFKKQGRKRSLQFQNIIMKNGEKFFIFKFYLFEIWSGSVLIS